MGKLEDADRVAVSSGLQWRAWLEAHPESTGVWAVAPRHLYDDLVEEALCFGWIDGTAASDGEGSRLWFAPRSPASAWASSNRDRVERLVREGRMTPRGQALIDAAHANGMWSVLMGPEAGVEPDELRAALAAAPDARATWDAYPPSVRKQALTAIALAKTPATITRRITSIVAAATEGRRPS